MSEVGEMKKSNIIIGVFLVALSIFYYLSTRGFPPPPVTENLGADFFPKFLAVILALLAMMLILGSLFFQRTSSQEEKKAAISGGERLEEDSFAVEGISYKFLLGSIGLSFLYAILLPFVGYLTTTSLFIFCMIRLLGTKQWLRNIAVSIILTVVLYLLFARILGVPLPDLSTFLQLFGSEKP